MLAVLVRAWLKPEASFNDIVRVASLVALIVALVRIGWVAWDVADIGPPYGTAFTERADEPGHYVLTWRRAGLFEVVCHATDAYIEQSSGVDLMRIVPTSDLADWWLDEADWDCP